VRRLLLYSITLSIGLGLALSCPPGSSSPPPPPGPPPEGTFQRGFVLGLFRTDPAYYEARTYVDELAELREMGCDSVAILVRQFMARSTSVVVEPIPGQTVPDHRLVEVLRECQRQGLRSTLFPCVLLQEAEAKEWRGNIQPESWESWFESYQEMLEHYASLAAQEQVAQLCVGSELVSSERFEEPWRALIASVRERFRGEVFYAANWDHYQDIPFLDATDLAAVNAYNRLAQEPTEDLRALTLAWEQIRGQLQAWSRRVGRPLLLTEVGYPSVDGCSVYPWDYTRKAPVDLLEQAACVEAFCSAWLQVPELKGVYFYVWWGSGGPSDRGYTPWGKPAEAVIRRYLAAQPGR